RTQTRFRRFVRERAGAEQLLEILNEEFGLKIEYEPQFGFVSIPEGRFVPDKEGGVKWFFFGRLAAQIRRMQKRLGMTSDQVVRGSLRALKKTFDSFSDGKLVSRDAQGNIVEWKSWKALARHMDRESELDELSD